METLGRYVFLLGNPPRVKKVWVKLWIDDFRKVIGGTQSRPMTQHARGLLFLFTVSPLERLDALSTTIANDLPKRSIPDKRLVFSLSTSTWKVFILSDPVSEFLRIIDETTGVEGSVYVIPFLNGRSLRSLLLHLTPMFAESKRTTVLFPSEAWTEILLSSKWSCPFLIDRIAESFPLKVQIPFPPPRGWWWSSSGLKKYPMRTPAVRKPRVTMRRAMTRVMTSPAVSLFTFFMFRLKSSWSEVVSSMIRGLFVLFKLILSVLLVYCTDSEKSVGLNILRIKIKEWKERWRANQKGRRSIEWFVESLVHERILSALNLKERRIECVCVCRLDFLFLFFPGSHASNESENVSLRISRQAEGDTYFHCSSLLLLFPKLSSWLFIARTVYVFLLLSKKNKNHRDFNINKT